MMWSYTLQYKGEARGGGGPPSPFGIVGGEFIFSPNRTAKFSENFSS